MRSEAVVAAAREGAAWSLSGVCFQLDSTLDDETRPISERRATPTARRDVPFDVAPCEYGDERDGKLMNVSALDQITAHLKGVLADIRGFRALLPDLEPSWRSMLLAVIDQFSGPGRHLILQGTTIPAQIAVGHKLAAGYYGVLRRILVAEAGGNSVTASADSFLDYVQRTRSLLGASEPCAGPPKQIAFLARLLIGEEERREGTSPGITPADPRRLPLSECLSAQLRLGIAWELFDEYAEHELLVTRQKILGWTPRNQYIERRFEERHQLLLAHDSPTSVHSAIRALPTRLSVEERARIEAAMLALGEPQGAPDEVAEGFRRVVSLREGALLLDGEASTAHFAQFATRYLVVRHAVVSALSRLERDIRQAIGWDPSPAMHLNAAIFPRACALDWFEVALGHRIDCAQDTAFAVDLVNHRRKVEVASNVATS